VPGRIVVGVDGSPGSDAALRWSVDHADALRATVTAVHCWTPPVRKHPGAVEDALEADFGAVLDQTVDRVVGGRDDVVVERVLREGDPAEVLTEIAHGSELLVLGSRGRSGLTGLVLGSVSRRCTQRATCPVLVVPTPPA